MQLKFSFGEHQLYQYDTTKFQFLEYFQKLYNKQYLLDQLHLDSNDFKQNMDRLELGVLNDRDTDLHQTFYTDIKSSTHPIDEYNPVIDGYTGYTQFKTLYCNLISDIHKQFYPTENAIIYQSFPSIRIQYPQSVAVPPHYDSDSIGNHPIGEQNFIIPITQMVNTNTLWIESSPGKKDFKSIDMEYGQLLYFNGNTCTHFNKQNLEGRLRISLDFRIILVKDYLKYLSNGGITMTNPRDTVHSRQPTKMIIGGYYQTHFQTDTDVDMMRWYKIDYPITQMKPSFGTEEANACSMYILNGGFLTEYKKTTELEQYISEFLTVKHCIMTTSGTCALILSLLTIGISRGDEVIVPNYTMVATLNAVKLLGATPIIIDVSLESWTISPQEIADAITTRTKAVIHVSLNNQCMDMTSIQNICKTHNLYLIEDSAQSFGCKYNGQYFGTFGDIGCFSLSSPKIISTGQGGMVVTNNDQLAAQLRQIKNFGRSQDGQDMYECFGINFKYTDLQAVVGLEQMKKLPERIYRIRQNHLLYYSYLKDIMKPPKDLHWFPWFNEIFVTQRELVSSFLKSHFVETRNTYPEMSETPMYKTTKSYPNSKLISTCGLFLPSYSDLTMYEIRYICRLIRLILN